MADTIAGYPTSGLERFVGGVQHGYENMTDIRKKSSELRERLAFEKAADSKPKKGIEDSSSTTTEDPYATGGTTGSGGGSGGGGGGGSGSGGGGGGKWGEYAAPIVDFFKKSGYTDAAVQAIMGNGLAEGGFANNWLPGDNGSSFGHWQFHRGGELDGYEKWARANGVNNLQDSVNQARFVDYRMTQIDPNFKNSTDAKAATNKFHIGFEKPKDQTPGLRFGHLATAQKYLAGGTGTSSPPMSAGSSAPVQVGGRSTPPAPTPSDPQPFNPSVGPITQTDYDWIARNQPSAAPEPAAEPAAAPPAALNLAPLPNTSLGSSGLGAPRMTGRPQQMSGLGAPPLQQQPQQQAAIGAPPQGAPPDVYARPQAPPSPSVLAQLVGQYLPQQNAALVPRNDLYSGLV